MEIVCDAKENVDGLVVVTEQPGKTQFKNLIACLRKKGFFFAVPFFQGLLSASLSPCLVYPPFALHDIGVPASQYSDLYYTFSIYVQ